MANELASLPSLGLLVGADLRDRREALGLSAADLARKLREVGLPWTVDVINALETGRREDVSVNELVLLAEALSLPDAAALLEGEGIVRLSPLASADLAWIRSKLGRREDADRGHVTVHFLGARTQDHIDLIERAGIPLASEAERHAAKRLGLSVGEVWELAWRRWGNSVDQERDRRLGDDASLSPLERRARRGHVTRDLLSELRTDLAKVADREPGPSPALRATPER